MDSQRKLRRAGWLFAGAFLLLAITIGLLGLLYLKQQQAGLRQNVQEQLAAIADLKVSQIVDWRNDRMDDARLIMLDPFFPKQVQKFLAHPADSELRRPLLEWFKSVQAHHGYGRAMLVDPQMNVRLAFPEAETRFGPIAQRFALAALQSNRVMVSDLHRSRFTGRIHFDLAIPFYGAAVLSESQTPPTGFSWGQPIGVIDMEINPQKFLYPLIQSWPTPSRTAETLLVRLEHDGDEVLFLNELRFQTNTALSMRMPISRQELPAVMAASGKEGVVEGRDYRGQPVLAAMRAVSQTPWFLVAKIDQAEVYAPIYAQGRLMLKVILLLIATIGLGLWQVWRQRENHLLKAEAAEERSRQRLAERLHHLTQQVNDIVLLVAPDLKIIEANDRATQTYGYTTEEFHILTMRKLRAPEFRAGIDQQLHEVEQRESAIYETHHCRKDGSIFPVEASVRLVEKDGQKFYQAIIRDITERKRTEAVLRESERKYRQLFELESDALLLVDNESGRILEANAAASALYGYSHDELLSLKEPQLATEAEATRYLTKSQKVFVPLRYHRRSDGAIFPAEITVHHFVWQGRGVHLAAVRDITQRKQDEESLRRSEQLYRTLVDASPDAILVTDLQAGIQMVNPPVLVMYGAQPMEELIGKNALELLVPEDQSRATENMRKTLAAGRLINVEYCVRRHDGSQLQVEVNGAVLRDTDNQPTGFILTVRDITERKQAEREKALIEIQLRQAQKMESFGRLATGIAHEIPTPILP